MKEINKIIVIIIKTVIQYSDLYNENTIVINNPYFIILMDSLFIFYKQIICF